MAVTRGVRSLSIRYQSSIKANSHEKFKIFCNRNGDNGKCKYIANSEIYPPVDKTSNSLEVAKLLQGDISGLTKELFGKVVFYLTEDGKIVVHSILTKDQYVRDYVAEKLKGQKLSGD